ncbi:MAG: fumarylacetoacetate hydrolase family protein [Chloroflexota bacterium]
MQSVKFIVFASDGGPPQPGLLTQRGAVALGDVVRDASRDSDSPQSAMEYVIDHVETLRSRLLDIADDAVATPLDEVKLFAPLPRPGKILCSTAAFDHVRDGQHGPLLMTLKSAESVIGPGETILLPTVDQAWEFFPEVELGAVIRGPAKSVPADAWRSVVFGFTGVVDVMARGDEQFGRDFWLAKADTLGPLGPCIVTADECADPTTLRVRSWVNAVPRQDYAIASASHSVGDQVAFATTVMTLHTGDVIACGTSPVGLQPITDGDQLDISVDGIGRMRLYVAARTGTAT